MNVTFICNELPPAPAGGIGHFVDLVAPAVAALGHTVYVVGVYDREYEWRLAGCEILAVRACPSLARRLMQRRLLRNFVPARFVAQIRHNEIRATLRKGIQSLHKPSEQLVVEWPSYQGLCNWSKLDIHHVLRLHGTTFMDTYSGDPDAGKFKHNEIDTARRIANWIGVSKWSIEETRKATDTTPKHSAVIANPVLCNMFHPAREKPPKLSILFAGTRCERKGDDRLATAANSFLKKYPAASLTYIGRHTEERASHIRSLISADLQSRVEIRENVSQEVLAKHMRDSAVFAMPSRGETFGMVYAEAMASGLPVVGGNATGIPEVVPDGEAGILVDANDVAAISQAVERLLASESLRREMGERGRRIAAEHYSLDTCVRKSVAFYAACLEQALATDFA